MRANVALFLLIVSSVPAWSLGKVTFGAEFTFWDPVVGVMNDEDPKMRVPPTSGKVIQRMRDHLIDGQPEGEKFIERDPRPDHHNSRGQFVSPHGWWFEWGYDDSVIEVNTIPADVDFYERFENDMQDAIFVSAANEGFYPALYLGGGHINLGLSAFDGNILLLRNFVVDHLFNHNELFLGIFNYDSHNAASIYLQTENIRNRVLAIIKDFDDGKYRNSIDGQKNFLRDIQTAMNSETDPCFVKWGTGGTRQCYFGLNFVHYNEGDSSRVEFRGVRAQASMRVWINQIRLIKKRLHYLEKFDKPIPIQQGVRVRKLNFSKKVNHLLNPPVNPQEALASFHRYVTESGEKWEDHRGYVWPNWESSGELKRFESRLAAGKNRVTQSLCELEASP